MNDEHQPMIPLLSVLDMIENASAMVRVANVVGTRRLVGMAPQGLRAVLESELIGVVDDVDRWLAHRGITITWYATGSRGAVLDLEDMSHHVVDPRMALVLWPAAE